METIGLVCFESTRTPGGVLITKTVVDSDKSGGFWVKAVNLSDETVMLFKNQKVGIITDIVDCSDPLNLSPEKDGPSYRARNVSLQQGQSSSLVMSSTRMI